VNEQGFTTAGDGVDLRQLPAFEPGSGLWSRIEAAHFAQRRRRRWIRGGFAAAVAMLAGVAVLLLPHPLPNLAQDTAAGQRESHALESEWQRLAGGVRPVVGGTTQLRVIDAALQAAYDRGALPDELAALWRERNQALRGLIARFQDNGTRDPLAVTRI
jgi:hypothetical protein